MATYQQALVAANKAGSAHATDAGIMAQFCATTLQLLVGAAAPQLVWEGAQQREMTARELVQLATENPAAVHELMW
jgi:phosphopantothenoylcysteine synthetase/decarboxylase